MLESDLASAIVYVGALLVALPLTAWQAFALRGEKRTDWLILLGFLVVASMVLLMQVRGVRLAGPFALPAGAWLITVARAGYLKRGGLLNAGRLLGSWLIVSGAAYYGVVASIAALTSPSIAATAFEPVARLQQRCLDRDTYAPLSGLSPASVMAPFRLGPHILLFTQHDIVSAGFHRNVRGTTDAIAFFVDGEIKARAIAAERGIDYVVICPGAPDYTGTIGPAAGQHWSWLEPISEPDERLQIYRVRF